MAKKRTKVQSQAINFVTAGTYQIVRTNTGPLNQAANAEFQAGGIDNINAAASKDEMYSWIRDTIVMYDENTFGIYEWFIIRCQAADAVQDLSDAAVLEELQRDGRILERGTHITDGLLHAPRVIKLEYHKVKLSLGEELRMVVLPILASAHFHCYDTLEYRKVGA